MNYTSSLPILVIENFGAGVIPQKGWSGDGSGIKQRPRQPAVWATFDRQNGFSALTHRPQMISRMGVRGGLHDEDLSGRDVAAHGARTLHVE